MGEAKIFCKPLADKVQHALSNFYLRTWALHEWDAKTSLYAIKKPQA